MRYSSYEFENDQKFFFLLNSGLFAFIIIFLFIYLLEVIMFFFHFTKWQTYFRE